MTDYSNANPNASLPLGGGPANGGGGDSQSLRLRSSADGVRFRESAEDGGPLRVTVLHLTPAVDAMRQRQQQQQHHHHQQTTARVTWDAEVRENPEQRVSKCCCVFHKKKLFGESSSDEDSSSSDSDSDSSFGGGGGRNGSGQPFSNDSDATTNAAADVQQDCHRNHHGCTHSPAEERDGTKPHKHRRPKCTKEHCYCGTRFH